jgi:hypothetical protein
MIIAKINPPVNYTTQVSPFSSVTVTSEYMVTMAFEYKPGSENTTFKVMFGFLVYNDEDDPTKITGFKNNYPTTVVLTSTELSNWGTNDEVMVLDVAKKFGLTITEYLTPDIFIQF